MASMKDNLSAEWTQTSPSTYERAMDSMDKFFIATAGASQGRPDGENWQFTAAIKIETDSPGVVDDPGSSTPFTNPIRRAVLHVFPQTQELVLQGRHAHMDGIGAATFFNHMLTYLVAPPATEPAFGAEGANLVPPTSIARVQPYTPDQKQAWDAALQRFLTSFPTVRLPTENKGAPAARTTTAWLTFDPADTARIVSPARDLGVTVTAVSLSAREHGKVPNTTHATFAIYNARPNVDAAEFPHEGLVGCNLFAMPVVYPLVPESFVEMAKKASAILRAPKENGILVAASSTFGTDISAALAAPIPEGMPVAADLQLSSLGVVEEYMGRYYRHEGAQGRSEIAVRDFWVALDLLGPIMLAEAWTSREKLVVGQAYNEAYYREESIVSLLRLIHGQLTQGLDLDLKFDARGPGDEWL